MYVLKLFTFSSLSTCPSLPYLTETLSHSECVVAHMLFIKRTLSFPSFKDTSPGFAFSHGLFFDAKCVVAEIVFSICQEIHCITFIAAFFKGCKNQKH